MEKTVGNLEGIRTRLIGAQAPVCVIEDTSLDTTSDALNGVAALLGTIIGELEDYIGEGVHRDPVQTCRGGITDGKR